MLVVVAAAFAFASNGPLGEKLGVGYLNASSLFKDLTAITQLEKGRYETTTDFEARRIKLLSVVIGSGRLEILTGANTDYDTDKQVLTVSIPCHVEIGDQEPVVGVGQSLEFGESYIGQNSYGAKAKVTKVYVTRNLLVCDNDDRTLGGMFWDSSAPLQIHIPMSPVTASKVESKLRVLLECDSRSPTKFSHRMADVHEPTIDDPRQSYAYDSRLSVLLRKVIVFDATSKDIICVRSPTAAADRLEKVTPTAALAQRQADQAENSRLWTENSSKAILDGVVPDEKTDTPRILAVGPNSRLKRGIVVLGIRRVSDSDVITVNSWAGVRRFLSGFLEPTVFIQTKDFGYVIDNTYLVKE